MAANPHPLWVVIAVIHNPAQQVLLTQRVRANQFMQGYWEFPGGKVEPGESQYQALTRELKEELAIDVTRASPILETTYHYPDRLLQLACWQIISYQGMPKGAEGQPLCWQTITALREKKLPPANRPLVEYLIQSETQQPVRLR